MLVVAQMTHHEVLQAEEHGQVFLQVVADIRIVVNVLIVKEIVGDGVVGMIGNVMVITAGLDEIMARMVEERLRPTVIGFQRDVGEDAGETKYRCIVVLCQRLIEHAVRRLSVGMPRMGVQHGCVRLPLLPRRPFGGSWGSPPQLQAGVEGGRHQRLHTGLAIDRKQYFRTCNGFRRNINQHILALAEGQIARSLLVGVVEADERPFKILVLYSLIAFPPSHAQRYLLMVFRRGDIPRRIFQTLIAQIGSTEFRLDIVAILTRHGKLQCAADRLQMRGNGEDPFRAELVAHSFTVGRLDLPQQSAHR